MVARFSVRAMDIDFIVSRWPGIVTDYRAVNLRDGNTRAVWDELAGADGDDGRDGAETLSRAAGV